MEHTKNILIIGDMPGYGKMGLAGMLPILSNMGHSVYNLPTALVSNNFDYGKFSVLDTTAYMEETIRVWQTLGFQFDCITTGFLASADQVDLLRAFIDSQRKADFLVVTDPIMGDGGKLYNGSTPQTVDNMRRFVGAADVIVPNLTEAEFLTGLYEGEELLTGAQARRILDKRRGGGGPACGLGLRRRDRGVLHRPLPLHQGPLPRHRGHLHLPAHRPAAGRTVSAPGGAEGGGPAGAAHLPGAGCGRAKQRHPH